MTNHSELRLTLDQIAAHLSVLILAQQAHQRASEEAVNNIAVLIAKGRELLEDLRCETLEQKS